MQAFSSDVILQIGAVRRDGTLRLAADAFSTIRLLWQDARKGATPLGSVGPLQAANANVLQRRGRRGPI